MIIPINRSISLFIDVTVFNCINHIFVAILTYNQLKWSKNAKSMCYCAPMNPTTCRRRGGGGGHDPRTLSCVQLDARGWVDGGLCGCLEEDNFWKRASIKVRTAAATERPRCNPPAAGLETPGRSTN